MKYKNLINDVVVETTNEVSGDWELVEEKKATPKKPTKSSKAKGE